MKYKAIFGLFSLCVAACAGRSDEQGAELEAPIINGFPVDSGTHGVVLIEDITGLGSGVLLTNNWLLTGAHVVDVGPLSGYTFTMAGQLRGGLRRIIHPNGVDPDYVVDAALVRLDGNLPVQGTSTNFRRHISSLSLADMMGGAVTCFGYGLNTLTSGEGVLRAGAFFASSSTKSGYFNVDLNPIGSVPFFGDSGGPCIDVLSGQVWGLIHGSNSAARPPAYAHVLAAETFVAWARQHMFEAGDVAGEFGDGDFKSDIVLTGGIGWGSIPVARSKGDGTFVVTNEGVTDFPAFATHPGAKPVPGDFNGDGKGDIALTGNPGWQTIPVAFSSGNGAFNVTNRNVSNFPSWAGTSGAKPVAGDFNGDGKDDIALVGGAGWASVPIAFSNGDGTFRVTNSSLPEFAFHSQFAKPVAGDFDGNGKSDIALTGGPGWTTIFIAYSTGSSSGTFTTTNSVVPDFPVYATQPGATPVAGDFNGDGKSDIALTAGASWGTIPVAFSNGNGTFNVTNSGVAHFPIYATQNGAKPVSGDFNGDGRGDIALTGGVGWGTVPVAFSTGNGSFNVTNRSVSDFPIYATQNGAKPVGGG